MRIFFKATSSNQARLSPCIDNGPAVAGANSTSAKMIIFSLNAALLHILCADPTAIQSTVSLNTNSLALTDEIVIVLFAY